MMNEEFKKFLSKRIPELQEDGWYQHEAEEMAKKEWWDLGDYIGQCPNCKRHRLCKTFGGVFSRCEKCDWSPELKKYYQGTL